MKLRQRKTVQNKQSNYAIALRKPKLNINDLPDTILLNIFQFLPHMDLYGKVRRVCDHWANLSSDRNLWKQIDVGSKVPLHILLKWLENAPKLQSLHVRSRKDAGQILNWVQKYNKDIKELHLYFCRGTSFRRNIPSGPLCNVLIRCPYLNQISLKGCRFISFKFFELFALRKMILEKRTRNIDLSKLPKIIEYYGMANEKQVKTYLQAGLKCGRQRNSILKICDAVGRNNMEQELVVDNEEDLESVLNKFRN